MLLTRYTACLAVLLALAVPALAQSGDRVYDEAFPFRPGEELSVTTSSTDVIVRTGGSDGARVEVYGRGGNVRQEFERLRFTAERQGGRLVLKTDRRSNGFFGRNQASFDIVVTLPEQHDLTVVTSSGDVSAGRLRGDLAVTTSSGDVELGEVHGTATIATSSGDVEADLLDGAVELSTSSGDFSFGRIQGAALTFSSSSGDFEADRVDVDRFTASSSSGDIQIDGTVGAAEVSTSSGDVRLGAVEGPLTLSTASGDVQAALTKPVRAEVSTGSGNVSLALPRAFAADVNLRGGTIRIDDALGFQGQRARRSAEGRLGGGGQPLQVRTGSGTISLRAN